MTDNILLIHGWGITHDVFNDLIIKLPEYKFITPDLPGYGNTDFSGDFNINNIANGLINSIDEEKFPIHLIAWSMGGLIAIIIAAKYPSKIKTLTLVSTFARYLKDRDYPCGVDSNKLENLYKLLDGDYEKYIKYFMEVQFYNSKIEKNKIAAILKNIFTDLPKTKPSSLLESLEAVITSDVRYYLKSIICPTLVMGNKRDLVTPYAMQEYLYNNIEYSEIFCFDNSAHAAFLSEEGLFIDVLNKFYMKNK